MPGTGPALGGRCQVCNNQRRYDAESFVRQGMAVAQAARAIGVERRSLALHMKNHATPADDALAGAEPVDGPADKVLDAIGVQLSRMLAGRLSTTQRLAILAEQRRLAVDRSRIVGPMEPPATVRVAEVEGLGEMFEDIHEALKEFPEARVAIREIRRRRAAAGAA